MNAHRLAPPITLLAVLFFQGASCLADPIYSFSGTTVLNAGPNTYGFQFTAVTNITVDSLGFFDTNADGLSTSHLVGIWNSTGTLLGSVTVDNTSALAGPVINGGQFRYTSFATALNLTAGATYTEGAYNGNGSDLTYKFVTNMSLNPALATISTGGFIGSGSFTDPTSSFATEAFGIAGFTAFATPSVVPEPGSLALCGIAGTVALAYTRARRGLARA